ncbi:MAG: ABC-F type ribosomal protection protein [Firmicutes bacterium]|nr:ABC-F type ribosomal protection protein [Bacillota bacterium]
MSEPILRVDNLTKSYGIYEIFTNVSFLLKMGEKAALVGPNGVGKSTLLKILAGEESVDAGTITWLREPLVCQYVPQMPKFGQSTPWSVLSRQAQRLGVLARGTPAEAISRFGFAEEEAHLPATQLSGGQKTRLALAKAWLCHPDLLLLDEPTNHLDIEALEWLEEFVLTYRGSVLIVSHDRAFLDSVVSRVLELSQRGITEYHGNYTAYREAKEKRFQSEMARYQAEQKRIRKLESAIEQQMRQFLRSHQIAGQHDFYRSKAKKLAKSAKAKMKRLEKMKQTGVSKPKAEQRVSFHGFESSDSGRRLIMAEDLGKAYNKLLFQNGNFAILRGDKVGLIGPNGAGKTTLLRMLLGDEEPTKGCLWVSPSASIGYLDQEMEKLDSSNTVLEEVLSCLSEQTRDEITRVRTFLAQMLFREEELEKPIGVLSVGEKKRVAMAKLLLSSHNLLLLDEPTDHLDLPSRERLEDALLDYEGTLVLVSHDRYLLRKVCNKVLAFVDGRLVAYSGGFAEYEEKVIKGKNQVQGTTNSGLSPEERLVLETKLAQLSADLASTPKDDPSYEELEKSFLELARRLR